MSKFDKKFQREVLQIAEKKLSHAMLLGGLSVDLNHLNAKNVKCKNDVKCQKEVICHKVTAELWERGLYITN